MASRPGGISAIADQQIAAGIMWVPGSIPLLIVLFVYCNRWLSPTGASMPAGAKVAGAATTTLASNH